MSWCHEEKGKKQRVPAVTPALPLCSSLVLPPCLLYTVTWYTCIFLPQLWGVQWKPRGRGARWTRVRISALTLISCVTLAEWLHHVCLPGGVSVSSTRSDVGFLKLHHRLRVFALSTHFPFYYLFRMFMYICSLLIHKFV